MKKYQICNGEASRTPTRTPGLSNSEIMTIMLMFQEEKFRNFKSFYNGYLQLYKPEFPKLPTYERFVALMPKVLYLFVILLTTMLRKNSKTSFIDSTPLKVCHNKRIFGHKTFKGIAARGKSTMGWFFGFKLHIIIDADGNLTKVKMTKGNTDDRSVVFQMTEGMSGFLFADKGYISNTLFRRLLIRGLKLITGIKKNMKNMLMSLNEKLLLRKRTLVEVVFDYLKNKFMIEHSRHRSFVNMLVHVVSTLVAYQMKPEKPHILMQWAIK
jgi:IS5 family transposase